MIPGYICIARRDRAQSENRGGVMCLAKLSFQDLVPLEMSRDAERIWLLLHLDVGSILLCNLTLPRSSDY